MTSVAMRLTSLRQRIEAASHKAGRDPSKVKLIAVSKLQPSSLIREAYAEGQRHFGENYAQELRDKAAGLTDCPEIIWHAIGPLQLNKAKYIAKLAHTFHALDRLELAQELSKRRQGPPLRCLLEVNLAQEATKSGVTSQEAPSLAQAIMALPNLELVGLMAMPPLSEDPEASRPHFRALATLGKALGLAELSMGSTSDFEVAIEEGATWIRVGTALFGERS